ncbi:YdeI/OmpD-associated family protein [Wenxinia saemankumensis]|uniref:Uncharacterized conserved protein YdeI, YjbR/CyaY-like superfamily, DUF1801 family n=1 Tax=Wenxinia saemankumensis TaxID=1447782 RepID=A0A1M6C5T1_9RHOB|nr:YdeI/OmpD-associated family protein [Wenxinia saemankumensis]SHI56369.1 Uncharacterized conserved protein YdeI, YjbR/CyaY-like superfamily, DUF1801 family [Wenxinia saemankumensis]
MDRAMITDPDVYFARGCGRCDRFDTADCSARLHAAPLAALRALCQDAGLEETAKWGHPVYMAHGRNIAMLGAFRADVVLTFFDAALMTDPDGVLVPAGPNSRHAGTIRFARLEDVEALAPTIRAYLAEAARYAAEGRRPPKEEGGIDLPAELEQALDDDPELAEAFHALTPGRQRSYAIALNSAKKAETRIARIGKFRPKILAGLGALER